MLPLVGSLTAGADRQLKSLDCLTGSSSHWQPTLICGRLLLIYGKHHEPSAELTHIFRTPTGEPSSSAFVGMTLSTYRRVASILSISYLSGTTSSLSCHAAVTRIWTTRAWAKQQSIVIVTAADLDLARAEYAILSSKHHTSLRQVSQGPSQPTAVGRQLGGSLPTCSWLG